jgi:hypothetical protein
MVDNAQIEFVIAHLNAQKQPSVAAAARETLSRRHRGIIRSYQQAAVTYRMKLSGAQEDILVAIGPIRIDCITGVAVDNDTDGTLIRHFPGKLI